VFRASTLSLLRWPLAATAWLPQRARLAEENRALRQQATALFVENSRLRELALEALRLEELLGMSRREDMIYFPARVIGRASSFGPQSVVLDRGLADGLRGGEALVTPWGLAGTLVEPNLRESRGWLLGHRDFRVRAMLQRSREEGILAGGADRLRLQDIPLSADVLVGDLVVTSGKGSRFPGGLPVGVVVETRQGGGLFQEVFVRPLAELERLEELFIVQPVPADSVNVRSLREGGRSAGDPAEEAGGGR
jgi:rod shape-determining protein MreC